VDAIQRVVQVDQKPIGRTPRSNLATYTGLFDHVRKLFAATPDARRRRFDAGRFSFNVAKGRCETCEGEGFVSVELLFMPSVYAPCPTCHGARYNEATLKVLWNGRNIAEVLQMTVDQAQAFFAGEEAIARPLQLLQEIGLGYLRLGQPATELSGARRSASSWRPSCSAASAGARCTCWTNPPPACMRRMRTGCWCSCSGWWTRETPW
jgi:excinuclease ABC subunit A